MCNWAKNMTCLVHKIAIISELYVHCYDKWGKEVLLRVLQSVLKKILVGGGLKDKNCLVFLYASSPCISKVSKNISLWGKTSPTKNNIWLLAAALLAAWHGVNKSQTQTYTLSAPKKRFVYLYVSITLRNIWFFMCKFCILCCSLKKI